jgi:hypothetical protein
MTSSRLITPVSRRAALIGLVSASVITARSARAGAITSGTPSPEAKATDEILVEITVPAEAFVNPKPGGDQLSFYFQQITTPANTTGTWETDARADYPGIEVEYLLEGTITVTAEGPVQVLRAEGDGTPEDAPAGTAIELGPGEAVVHRLEQPSVWTSGDAPVALLAGFAVANAVVSEFIPEEWESVSHTFADGEGPVPTGPTVVRLRQIVLEPDASVAFAPDILKVFMLAGGSAGFLGEGSDGSLTLKGATEATTLYVFSLQPAEDAATPAL